ncbi:MAG: TonB-dependent receptor [Pseudomonadota bacterium]
MAFVKSGASTRGKMAFLAGVSTLALAASPAAAQGTSAQEDDEIVVRGVRSQLLEASEIERNAVNVQSVITADDIGQFPDQNIAESLQRLPGLVIIRDEGEGRFVSVRGLPSEFAQVTVNNAQIGSSDSGGNRSTALDVIPSDLLSKVEVNKSLLPDQDHDSLGAKIDLRPLSAFDRTGDFTGRILAQGTYTANAGEVRPKITADITRRFDLGGGELGLAAAFNYFEREVQLDRLQTDSGGATRLVERDDFDEGTGDEETVIETGFESTLLPQELDQRIELGRRDRLGATFSADYRSDGGSLFSFSALYGRLEDDDIRVQQEVELRDAREDEIVAIGVRSGQFSDVDIDRQVFFQQRNEDTIALHFEGLNPLGGGWTLSYAVDWSQNNFEIDDALRSTFRERDLIVDAVWDENSADFSVAGKGDNDDKADFELGFLPELDDFNLVNALIINEDRQDEILSWNADLQKDFSFNGRDGFIKLGYKQRERDRSFLRGERETGDDLLEDNGFDLSLEDVETFRPDTTLPIDGGIPGGALFPALGPHRELLNDIKDTLGLEAGDRRRDFVADERTIAGYLMGQVELSDTLQFVGGVRVENTKFMTTGTFGRVFTEDEDNAGFDFETIETFENDYTEWLPSASFRWEPAEEIVVRLGYSRGQVRPSYGDASALRTAEVDYVLAADADPGETITTINLGGTPTDVAIRESEFDGGNPGLNALTANQFDATFGWYPSEYTIFTVAGFYKDLKNTFVSVEFDDPDSITGVLGFNVDPVSGAPIGEVDTVINGGSGELFGAEIALSHFLSYLDGPLSGLFATGNVTLIDASTTVNGNTIRLPGSSEISGNASVGYETDQLLLRLALNYRGEQLRSVADDPEEDEFQESYLSLDATLRYNISDNFQLFFDAVNINKETESRFFRGANNLPLYSRFEDFGRTFQFGVVASF